MALTEEQIKRMQEKADLSDLRDEIRQIPDHATRRAVREVVDRVDEVMGEILDVLEVSEDLKSTLAGKQYLVKFEQEHDPA